jgi:hypothetical protein
MKKWTRVGIIILIIGVSLLAGTIYRSNTTHSTGYRLIDLAPNTWSLSEEDQGKTVMEFAMELYCFLSAPREFRLEVRATAAIDVCILDLEGIKQWKKDKTVEPLWEFKETEQDKYMLLLYNPTNENVTSELHMMIYGIEKDLLHTSVAFIATGLVFTVGSVIITRKQPTIPE